MRGPPPIRSARSPCARLATCAQLADSPLSPTASVIHLWLRCVESELRGYFFIQSSEYLSEEHLVHRPTWVATQPSSYLADGSRPRHFQISVNGSAVPLVEDVGGGTFLTQLNTQGAGQDSRAVTITVVGWTSWVDFPLSYCVARKVKSIHEEPQLAVVTVAFSDTALFHSKALSAEATEAMMKHALYHRCLLGISRYELVVRDEVAQPLLDRIAAYPWIVRMRPPTNPGQIRLPGMGRDVQGNLWQAIYHNLAILRHWGDNLALMMIDMDEFLVVRDRNTFLSAVFDSDVLSIPRKDALCTGNCSHTSLGGSRPDIYGFPLSGQYSTYGRNRRVPAAHFWQKSSLVPKTLEPKVALQPERVHNMFVHHAIPVTVVQELDSADGHLLHFYNLIKARVDPRSLDETWEQRFHLVEPVTLSGQCWVVSESDPSLRSATAPTSAGGAGGYLTPSHAFEQHPDAVLASKLRGEILDGTAPGMGGGGGGSVLAHIMVDVVALTLAALAAYAYRANVRGGEALKGAAGAAAAAGKVGEACSVAVQQLMIRVRARAGTGQAQLAAAFQARFDALRAADGAGRAPASAV